VETTDIPSSIHPEPKFLTVKEVAEFLNVSNSLIYKLCTTQRLRHFRFGDDRGAIRVGRAELEEFVKRCKIEKRVPTPKSHCPKGQRLSSPSGFIHLDFRPKHACGAKTKAGTSCCMIAKEEKCHSHRSKSNSR
jgi:excisionase family DNA binding protein